MQAVLLVGGLGTRLRSLSGDRPKPMMPVAGRPFLQYLLVQLKNYGIRDVVLCVGYRAEMIQDHFGRGERLGINVRYSLDTELRGTAGALRLAQEFISGDTFITMNGDSFFDADLQAVVRFHENRRSAATMALVHVEDSSRYGTVDVDDDGRIVGFKEKQWSKAGLVNGGIYVFGREVLGLIPEGRAVSLEHEIFPRLVDTGFDGLPFRAPFVDIGDPEDCLRLQNAPEPLLRVLDQRR
ncbi:MAG: nucleotidyltransferase family protein [bacterium]